MQESRIPSGKCLNFPTFPTLRVALRVALLLSLLGLLPATVSHGANTKPPCAILIHGITKDSSSMVAIEKALVDAGFFAINLDYPSRKFPIETLAVETIPRGLAACEKANAAPVYMVAHSMGGLLVRQYYESRDTSQLAGVVMLGPPNRGSRLGNFLSCIPWIKDVNGPAGKQMGVDERSVPSRLGPVKFPLGVVAGTRSFNPLFSAIIHGDDDGIVGLPSTYVEGVCARVQYPVTHDNLTDDPRVIDQVVHYLQSGTFAGEQVEYFRCGNDTSR
nr:alpha/beta fold hydrolase [Microbulbifer sp. ALW1]